MPCACASSAHYSPPSISQKHGVRDVARKVQHLQTASNVQSCQWLMACSHGFTRTPAPPRSELPPSHFTPSFHLRAVTQYWKTGKADDQGQGTNKLSLSTGMRSHYPRMLAIRKMTTDSIQRTRSRLQRLLCTGIVPGAGTQRQTQSLPASQKTE